LVKKLLATFDTGAGIGEGVRVPRINSRPVAARSVPFTLQIPSSDFVNNKLQIRALPDTYRTFAYTVDHGQVAQVTPLKDDLSLENANVLPLGTKVVVTPDFSVSGGNVVRADPVDVADGIEYHTILGRNETQTHVLSPGAKAYLFEGIQMSADPQFKWKGQFQSFGSNLNTVRMKAHLIGAQGPTGRLIISTIATQQTNVDNVGVYDLVFADQDWVDFATAATLPTAKGIFFSFEFTTADGAEYRGSESFTVIWANNKPVFTSPAQWRTVSLWDMLGAAGTTLQAEYEKAAKSCVTHFDVRFTDFVATLNRNGTLSATQTPAATAKLFPSDVDECIRTIDTIGINEYSWKGQPEQDGITFVTHFDNPESWVRKPSTWLINKGQDLDDVDLPMMIFAADFAAGVSPSPHVIKLIGSINFEWETTSLAFDLKFPPSNFSRFNEAYFQAVTKECPFTHNPTHIKEIAQKISNVMSHPLMKFVIKSIGEVGLAALVAL